MIWIILVVVIIIFIALRFVTDLSKDNDDLQNQNLAEKFIFIVNIINKSAFNENGSITAINKREFNLYEEGQNQIIKFHYSTGHLTITWKYKYFQKEIIHERQFDNVRNLSVFEQMKVGEVMIKEMSVIVAKHKNEILNNI